MTVYSLPLTASNPNTLSFSSTLYLRPILDLLLANIPVEFQPELRLGLQEALVNAAKHGNQLDPQKTVVVRYQATNNGYFWAIKDEGQGFVPDYSCPPSSVAALPPDEATNGRGLCLLHQIFDQVRWFQQGKELQLYKELSRTRKREPILC